MITFNIYMLYICITVTFPHIEFHIHPFGLLIFLFIFIKCKQVLILQNWLLYIHILLPIGTCKAFCIFNLDMKSCVPAIYTIKEFTHILVLEREKIPECARSKNKFLSQTFHLIFTQLIKPLNLENPRDALPSKQISYR